MSSSVPKTTKAIQYVGVGGPEVIELAEIETPVPKPDEILVKVEWAGVNFGSLCSLMASLAPCIGLKVDNLLYYDATWLVLLTISRDSMISYVTPAPVCCCLWGLEICHNRT